MFYKKKIERDFINYVTENQQSLYRFAYSYMKNQQDALDIVQESIRKGLCSIQNIQESAAIKSWFYRIIINTSIDLIRKRKREQLVEDETIEFIAHGNEDRYEDIDLREAVESLPHTYKTIIILRFFEDLKIEEIAQVLEENPNTIKTRLYRALKLLRMDLDTSHSEGKLNE
ncbi:RNA polymerase sigma factor [Bacillus massiliigorillae]|uniref:RNA polymerase sigma factor n=1 Tax=Bacillus massiliigorillae TaxID=1243664 RepID=UPI00039FF9AD|nr:sigma-70 family RNA polymerase sigma factor [Bacillus massiliigorillae]